MPELIAVKPLKYPHAVAIGERFTVDDKSARALKRVGLARDPDPVVPNHYATRELQAEQPSEQSSGDLLSHTPRRKREYQRRDMVAQD